MKIFAEQQAAVAVPLQCRLSNGDCPPYVKPVTSLGTGGVVVCGVVSAGWRYV